MKPKQDLHPQIQAQDQGKEVSDALTYEVIGSAQKVHRTLGPGFTESTYQAALEKELTIRRIPFEAQREFKVFYEGELCGAYRPDLVLDNRIVLELKAVSVLAKEHRCQTLSYLRASTLSIALLINFGSPSLEVRRLLNNKLNPKNPEIH
jgi:GxxExxY protein